MKVWVFYLIPQKQGGRGWSNFLSFQYSTTLLKDRLPGYVSLITLNDDWSHVTC